MRPQDSLSLPVDTDREARAMKVTCALHEKVRSIGMMEQINGQWHCRMGMECAITCAIHGKHRSKLAMHQVTNSLGVSEWQCRPDMQCKVEVNDRGKSSVQLNKDITNLKSIHEVLDFIQKHLADFDQFNLRAAYIKIARVNKGGRALSNLEKDGRYLVLEKKLLAVIADPNVDVEARTLCNISWALATAKLTNPVPFHVIAKTALQDKVKDFNAQHLANTVWAFAQVDCVGHTEFFKAIAKEAAGKMTDFNAQNMANAAWALVQAKISGAEADEFFNALSVEALTRLPQLNTQNLANLAWAISKQGPGKYQDLLDAIGGEVDRRQAEDAMCLEHLIMLHEAIGSRSKTLSRAMTEVEDKVESALQSLTYPVKERTEYMKTMEEIGCAVLGYDMTNKLLQKLSVATSPNAVISDDTMRQHLLKQRQTWAEEGQSVVGLACAIVLYDLKLDDGDDPDKILKLDKAKCLVSGVTAAPVGLLNLLNATESPECTDPRQGRVLASARLPQFGTLHKHHLDAEFQGLSMVMEAVVERRVKIGEIEATFVHRQASEVWTEEQRARVSGSVRLHVGQTPCLSCIGAMCQFARGFPKVKLEVSFDTKTKLFEHSSVKRQET